MSSGYLDCTLKSRTDMTPDIVPLLSDGGSSGDMLLKPRSG